MSFKDLDSTHVYRAELAKLDFAMEVQAALERCELNNSELAERMGVSKPMISKLLRGDANMTIDTMVKVAHALKGDLFLKIVQNGCSARFFEVAQAAKHRSHEIWGAASVRNFRQNVPGLETNYWPAANEEDEIQSVAA